MKTAVYVGLGLVVLVASTTFVEPKSAAEWKTRAVYQLLTDRFSPTEETTKPCPDLSDYCGGTFRGIINHLDYISGMGFNAIWISPIPVQVNSPYAGYHGYWFKDLWQINPHFGQKQDLTDLVTECHKRDIWVMLDVVMNHCGPVNMDFSEISPFNESKYYHRKCQIQDWNNQTQVEICRLANLPDLNQSQPFVFEQLTNWTQHVINDFGVDGLRVDTTPEVDIQWFWKEWKSNYVTKQTFSTGEVLNGDVNYVAPYANVMGSVLSYPLYFSLRDVFANQKSMYEIRGTLKQYNSSINDPSVLGTFIDNHDNPRFLHQNDDWKLYQNVLTYITWAEGIPIVYYGTEQAFNGGNDPQNREALWPSGFDTSSHFYQLLQTLLKYKLAFIADLKDTRQIERYCTDNIYAFSRGYAFVATTNVGSNGPRLHYTISYHPYSNGETICNIFYPNDDCVTVHDGTFELYLLEGESKVFLPASKLASLGSRNSSSLLRGLK
eukprot:gb/GECG01011079.1/.p1 GENE.gb/GECG01011079.1/~~gb/GECG01011079.1/.p1  ORF type:complete len:493 (+),score=38.17 gb/GECG01011079.1/:1-1479(+)